MKVLLRHKRIIIWFSFDCAKKKCKYILNVVVEKGGGEIKSFIQK